MRWHRITLSRQEYESGEMALLLSAFRAAYVATAGLRAKALEIVSTRSAIPASTGAFLRLSKLFRPPAPHSRDTPH